MTLEKMVVETLKRVVSEYELRSDIGYLTRFINKLSEVYIHGFFTATSNKHIASAMSVGKTQDLVLDFISDITLSLSLNGIDIHRIKEHIISADMVSNSSLVTRDVVATLKPSTITNDMVILLLVRKYYYRVKKEMTDEKDK